MGTGSGVRGPGSVLGACTVPGRPGAGLPAAPENKAQGQKEGCPTQRFPADTGVYRAPLRGCPDASVVPTATPPFTAHASVHGAGPSGTVPPGTRVPSFSPPSPPRTPVANALPWRRENHGHTRTPGPGLVPEHLRLRIQERNEVSRGVAPSRSLAGISSQDDLPMGGLSMRRWAHLALVPWGRSLLAKVGAWCPAGSPGRHT